MVTSGDIKFIIASAEGYNAEFKILVPSKARELIHCIIPIIIDERKPPEYPM